MISTQSHTLNLDATNHLQLSEVDSHLCRVHQGKIRIEPALITHRLHAALIVGPYQSGVIPTSIDACYTAAAAGASRQIKLLSITQAPTVLHAHGPCFFPGIF
jgi:hypothetical protein